MGGMLSTADFTAVAARMGAYCQAIDRGDAGHELIPGEDSMFPAMMPAVSSQTPMDGN